MAACVPPAVGQSAGAAAAGLPSLWLQSPLDLLASLTPSPTPAWPLGWFPSSSAASLPVSSTIELPGEVGAAGRRPWILCQDNRRAITKPFPQSNEDSHQRLVAYQLRCLLAGCSWSWRASRAPNRLHVKSRSARQTPGARSRLCQSARGKSKSDRFCSFASVVTISPALSRGRAAQSDALADTAACAQALFDGLFAAGRRRAPTRELPTEPRPMCEAGARS